MSCQGSKDYLKKASVSHFRIFKDLTMLSKALRLYSFGMG
jgi:hypothetical protein